MNNRREFLKFSAGIVPAIALGLPLLHSAPLKSARMMTDEEVLDIIRKNSKVFCLESGGDTSYIIAESPERVKHWWFTELGGEPIPDDAEVTEISPDTVISQGIDLLEDISEEDQKHYLYYQIVFKEYNGPHISPPLMKWNYEMFKEMGVSPLDVFRTVDNGRFSTEYGLTDTGLEVPECRMNFCIKKPAELFLKDTIENQYPIPCCFCSTAG